MDLYGIHVKMQLSLVNNIQYSIFIHLKNKSSNSIISKINK
jgi:hypothetical protein